MTCRAPLTTDMVTRRSFLALTALATFLTTRVSRRAEAAASLPVYADLFESAFKPGFSWKMQLSEKDPPKDVPFTLVEAGKLKITSGKVSACDPFVTTQLSPFTQKVPKGLFPVRLACPQVHGKAGGRVAFARLDFRDKPVHHWQMAVTSVDDLAKLPKGEIYGYPVDSGTGSFADQSSYEAAFALTLTNEPIVDDWLEKGQAEGQKVGLNFFLNRDVDPKTHGNVIMFESGWGDGYYASYFGYDADGQVIALLTDFAVVE